MEHYTIPQHSGRTTWLGLLASAWVALVPLFVLPAQEFDERFSDWPINLKINGRLLAANFIEDCFDNRDRIPYVFEPTVVYVLYFGGSVEDASKRYEVGFKQAEFVTVEQLRDGAAAPEVLVCEVDSGGLEQFKQAMGDVSACLKKQLEAGGTLVAIGESVGLLSNVTLTSQQAHPSVEDGLDLFPDCVIYTDYLDSRDRNRLLSVLASHPRRVGIGLEQFTVLVLSGRKLSVVGEGVATLLLMADEQSPVQVQTLAQANSARANPEESQADLTQWRRQAIDRTLEPFPAKTPNRPQVETGTLFIVGGGGMPAGLMEQFVEQAGGKAARLVYVPCSEDDRVSERQSMVDTWNKMGVEHAAFLHTKDRQRANEDEEFYQPLKTATGIWFGGGRQWNFSDSYYGTTTHSLMKQVLQRGGVIGGSSAGASIQARYLARATPINNFRIMAPGYERGGLGFIDGVAIDQHFTQRNRHKDMTQLVDRYPQLLGIGIDETTALVVTKSVASVTGKGRVHFYDRTQPANTEAPDFIALESGQRYDLANRLILPQPPGGNPHAGSD